MLKRLKEGVSIEKIEEIIHTIFLLKQMINDYLK